jgi:hypothetical protein
VGDLDRLIPLIGVSSLNEAWDLLFRCARPCGLFALNRWPSLRLVLDALNVLDQQRDASLREACHGPGARDVRRLGALLL